MTRYLCIDPSHMRGGRDHPVDVTAEVRLERELLPRPTVYLAGTNTVIAEIVALDDRDPDVRRTAIRKIVLGTTAPSHAPVVLASERAVLFHGPGMHELDDLRLTEPGIDRLFKYPTPDRPHDHVLVPDVPDPGSTETADEGGKHATRGALATTTLAPSQVVATPQGVFDPWELTDHLAVAEPTPAALADAIRHAPQVAPAATYTGEPWRVVITCPRVEGTPAETHELVFTGTGEVEPPVVHGTRAGTLELAIESSIGEDFTPSAEVARAERRLGILLGAEVIIAIAVLVVAWLSGGLATAARETPGWLAAGIGVALAALAIGGAAMLAPKDDPLANANDTFVARGLYASRLQLLHIASLASGAVFAIALMLAMLPPALAVESPHPAVTVSITDVQETFVLATVEVEMSDLATDEDAVVEMRAFGTSRSPGTTVGVVTVSGNSEGVVHLAEQVALDPDASYLAVRVTTGDRPMPECTPLEADVPGCTLVALPTPSTEETITVIVTPGTVPTETTSPVTEPTSSPTALPTT